MGAIKEYEAGKSIIDLCREFGINKAPLFNLIRKYSGMNSQELKRLKEIEEENRKLKQRYAELALDNKEFKDVISNKF